jgi:hypothetical protein
VVFFLGGGGGGGGGGVENQIDISNKELSLWNLSCKTYQTVVGI